jgi:hypothetical protein
MRGAHGQHAPVPGVYPALRREHGYGGLDGLVLVRLFPPLSRVDKAIEAYFAVRLDPRERRDFPDWRKLWNANYTAYVRGFLCWSDRLGRHVEVGQCYGWKPLDKKDAGRNLLAAEAWLSAKRYGYLFVAARRAKPREEEARPAQSHGYSRAKASAQKLRWGHAVGGRRTRRTRNCSNAPPDIAPLIIWAISVRHTCSV